MSTDRKSLIDSVAEAVSDGKPVDWDRAAGEATDPRTRVLLRQLRVLSEIADVHRTLPEEAASEGSTLDVSATAPPKKWCHLTVQDAIGHGAFGTVYRAWDPRLDREVALKLIPERLYRARAADVIEEARLLAKVHHPNVVTVYGADHADGFVGIWMELIEGRTLEEILDERGRFSAREAVVVGLDVCEALAAIHGAGLLHRDVKAHNVMRDRNGRIVVMDFGTGRERSWPGGIRVADLAGTPLYMAPELFTGQEASARSDVYSVGVLLYRLVTGTLPIVAKSLDDVREAHAKGQVKRLRDERSDLPAAFVHTVERALSPDPARRFESAGAFESALLGLLTASSEPPSTRSGAFAPLPGWAFSLSRRWVLAVSAVTLALAAVGLWQLVRGGGAGGGPTRQVRFLLNPPSGTEFESLALSPDGTRLAFTAGGQLRVRAFDALDATLVPESQGANAPFWSPDGRHIAFFKGTMLWRVEATGGEPRAIGPARRPSGGSWGPDDVIVYAAGHGSGLFRVSAAGGQPEALRAEHPTGATDLRWPMVLPFGGGFIYSARVPNRAGRVLFAGSLNATSASADSALVEADGNGLIVNGELLFTRGGRLFAQAFDQRLMQMTGQPRLVASQLDVNPYDEGFVDISVSTTGTLAYLGGRRPDRELRMLDRTGRVLKALGLPGEYRDLAVSPSGTQLAFEERDPETGLRDIWVMDLERGHRVRLSAYPGNDIAPTWGPNSRDVYFASQRPEGPYIMRSAIDGSAQDEIIAKFPRMVVPFDVSSDGRWLAYQRLDQTRGWDLELLPLSAPVANPDTDVTALRQSAFNENEPRLSPDGKWVLYSSTDSGSRAVYLEPVPPTGQVWRVSADYGRHPYWRADAREVFFHGRDRQLMAATIDLRSSKPIIGLPQPLFRLNFRGWDTRYHFAITPDGQRFIVNTPVDGSEPLPATIVMNWNSR